MSRNRIIYPNEVVYFAKYIDGDADPNPNPEKANSLIRVQNVNYSLDIPRTDVNQYGMLASIETLVTESPTITTDITYLSSDGTNERNFGMQVNPISDIGSPVDSIVGDLLEHDGIIYVVIGPEGHDILNGYDASFSEEDYEYFGMGNSSLSNYTVNGAVGDYLSTSITFESLFIISDELNDLASSSGLGKVQPPTIDTATGNQLDKTYYELPSPNMRTTESPCSLMPGDITLIFPPETANLSLVRLNATGNQAELKVQNFSLSLPLSRTPLDRLGTKYSYAKEVDFPINATLTISAIARNFTEKDLSKLLSSSGNFTIKCAENGIDKLAYEVKGARLRSEAYSSGVGDNMTVDLSYEIPISAKNDQTKGIFLFGTTDITRSQLEPPTTNSQPDLEPDFNN